MEDKPAFLEPLLDKVEEYGKINFELIRLKAIDKAADFTSTFASRCFAVFFICLFILIASFGLSLWIGNLLGQLWYGFFCVAGFYGILGFVFFFLLHNFVKKFFGNLIISKILN